MLSPTIAEAIAIGITSQICSLPWLASTAAEHERGLAGRRHAHRLESDDRRQQVAEACSDSAEDRRPARSSARPAPSTLRRPAGRVLHHHQQRQARREACGRGASHRASSLQRQLEHAVEPLRDRSWRSGV